jgi:hypothetical protein
MDETLQGGLPVETPTETPTGGLTATTDKNGKITPAGKIALDPTQTSEILKNMQSMIDERESPLREFEKGLQRASAWGSGGIHGPAQALAQVNTQQAADQQSTFNMRTQMAAYKAAQTQQENFNKQRSQTLGTTAGGAGGVTIPKEIKLALSNAQTKEEYDKIYNTWAQKNAEVSANPDMDVPKIPVVDIVDGKYVRKNISVREYRENPNRYKDTPQTKAAVQEAAPEAAPSTKPTVDIAAEAKTAGIPVISGTRTNEKQQELYDAWIARGKTGNPVAKPGTSKHETGNAIDVDMDKATPDNIMWLQQNGYTQPHPSDANHWEKSAAPVATPVAAPGATAVAPPPPAPVAAPAALPAAPPPTKLGTRPTPEDLERQEKVAQTYKEGIAKGYGENVIKDEAAFRATTEPKSVSERKTSAERVVELVHNNPKAVGVIAKPGVANALATIARDGLNTPSGAIGIRTIEDALQLSMPGGDQKTVNARKEIAQNLARGALEASKLSQGQGSVSDFERSMFEKIAGSLADTPELLIKRQKMLIARADLDQKLGNLYRQRKTPGAPTDYDAFTTSPDVVKLVDTYEEQLRGILKNDVILKGTAPTSGKTPGGITFKVIQPAKP